MTPELIAHVKRVEGWRDTAYRCPAGVWTIGWGRTHGVKPGDTTTKAKEERWLYDYLTKCSASALYLSPNLSLEPPPRLAAIEDFIFNCGAKAYEESTLRKRVGQSAWKLAANEMKRWVFAGGEVEPGLVTRRAVAAHWLETGAP